MKKTIVELLEHPTVSDGDEITGDGFSFIIGEVDVHALLLLKFLSNILPDDSTYADMERVLVEAIWWSVTINTALTGKEEGAC